MYIFESQQTRVDSRIDVVVPQLEDVGSRGLLITKALHELKNALKFPKSNDREFFGSEKCIKEVHEVLENIKHELNDYAETSGTLIQDLTKILTETR